MLRLTLLLLSLATSAQAADAPRWVFAPAECDRLIAHAPDADVTYRPGQDIDADGRLIAPADLPGNRVAPPKTVAIDITQFLGRRPLRQEMWIGRLEVGPDGQAALNGMPLDDGEQAALAAYCARVHGR